MPMEVAAAAPRIGWSDLAYALVPTGRTLDYRSRNPYGDRLGVVKDSYLEALFAVGETGYYAPQGADPEADIRTWKAYVSGGEPYDAGSGGRRSGASSAASAPPTTLQADLPDGKRVAPAPTVIYNAWTDDIMPAGRGAAVTRAWRASVYPARQRRGRSSARASHTTAARSATPPTLADEEREKLFDRYLMGDMASPAARRRARRPRRAANGAPELGPFKTPELGRRSTPAR